MNEKMYRALRNAKFDEIVSKGKHYNKATLINCYTLKVHEKVYEYTSEKINNSRVLFNFLKKIEDQDFAHVETFKVLYLNRANQIKGYQILSVGGTNSVIVDQKLIFKVALDIMAEAIVISHNHPSGQVRPSNEDLKITKNIEHACKVLGIAFLDHIITTEDNYFSFADDCLLTA